MTTPALTTEPIPTRVRRALRATIPTAGVQHATLAGVGFEVTAWRVPDPTGDWLLRVPRQSSNLEDVAGELESWLCLATALEARALPVPSEPRLIRDADGRPLASAYRYVEGSHAAARGRTARSRLASSIAAFLADLHAIDLDHMPCEVPRADAWRDSFGPLLERCTPMLPPATQSWLRDLAGRLERASRTTPPPVLLHADLKPEHILVDETGSITAILDFEDLNASDPALDFCRLIQWWDRAFAEQVLSRYIEHGGRADPHLLERAQCYRDLDALQVIDTAIVRDWPGWLPWARRNLAARAAAATRISRSP